MRLKLLLPDVKADKLSQPKQCPRTACAGMKVVRQDFKQALGIASVLLDFFLKMNYNLFTRTKGGVIVWDIEYS